MKRISEIDARDFYTLFAVLHGLLIAAYLPSVPRPYSQSFYSVMLVSLALIYDNIIVAIGHRIVAKDRLFLTLSRLRFILHLIGTPLLAGVALDKTKFRVIGWWMVVILILLGIGMERSRQREMFIANYWNSIRYSERPPVLPVPAIITTLLVILGGVLRDQLPVTFGGCGMMAFASLPPAIHGPLFGQFGEVLIMYGMWNALLLK